MVVERARARAVLRWLPDAMRLSTCSGTALLTTCTISSLAKATQTREEEQAYLTSTQATIGGPAPDTLKLAPRRMLHVCIIRLAVAKKPCATVKETPCTKNSSQKKRCNTPHNKMGEALPIDIQAIVARCIQGVLNTLQIIDRIKADHEQTNL